MPKKLESGHKILSLEVLATGRLLLVTENRVYEHKDGKWEPMVFADDPVDPPVQEPDQTASDPVWPSGKEPSNG